MRTLAAICVTAGLLAGCSSPAEAPTSTSSVTLPSVQPGVMPNLIGLPWSDANSILRKLGGVNVKTVEVPVTDPSQKSHVISQDPATGSHIQPGAKITLTFGK